MNETLSRENAAAARFAGKNVALIHPAWHSCGTYRSVVGQIAAYRAFGARVFPIAISVDPGYSPEWRWIWRSYIEATPELDAGERYFGGVPFHVYADPRFLRDVVWPYIHGDQAKIRAGSAARARISAEVANVEFVEALFISVIRNFAQVKLLSVINDVHRLIVHDAIEAVIGADFESDSDFLGVLASHDV